jgi:D-3-phosphoglycerate dehydrogenase
MQVARDSQGGEALMAITVDSTIPAGIVDQVKKDTGAESVVSVSLVS